MNFGAECKGQGPGMPGLVGLVELVSSSIKVRYSTSGARDPPKDLLTRKISCFLDS